MHSWNSVRLGSFVWPVYQGLGWSMGAAKPSTVGRSGATESGFKQTSAGLEYSRPKATRGNSVMINVKSCKSENGTELALLTL